MRQDLGDGVCHVPFCHVPFTSHSVTSHSRPILPRPIHAPFWHVPFTFHSVTFQSRPILSRPRSVTSFTFHYVTYHARPILSRPILEPFCHVPFPSLFVTSHSRTIHILFGHVPFTSHAATSHSHRRDLWQSIGRCNTPRVCRCICGWYSRSQYRCSSWIQRRVQLQHTIKANNYLPLAVPSYLQQRIAECLLFSFWCDWGGATTGRNFGRVVSAGHDFRRKKAKRVVNTRHNLRKMHVIT